MNTQQDRNEKKFAEPRGWSAKWCGHGLSSCQNRSRVVKSNGNGKKFAKPRGWSVKWCGVGLFRDRER
jgi:hypothetical protein